MNWNDRALDAYLDVWALEGWAAATLDRVAREADLPLSDVLAGAGDCWQALDAVARRADLAALAAVVPMAGASTRDRLFDLIMARFDAMAREKPAAERLRREALTRPALGAALVALLGRTAVTLLSAAGEGTTGLVGLARVQALSAILLDVGRGWMRDDDPDLGQTMSQLNRRLEQAERCVSGDWLLRRRDKGAGEEGDPAAAV